MEYTRHSSQPATVDLVRADLGEIWTIDGLDVESPKPPRSVSGVSDMLDLEFLPTPGPRPSKATRKDPLEDMLGDLLELTPSHRRGRQEKQAPNAGSSDHGEEVSAHNDKPGKRPGRGSPRQGKLSDPSSRSPSSASPREPQERGRPSSNANKRKRPNQPTAAVDTHADAPVPKPRRQGQSNGKQTAASAARKRPTKGSTQPKASPPAVKSASTRTRAKRRPEKRDDDLFELSDATDSEEEARPKKRQPKQPSPKRPPTSFISRTRVNGDIDLPVKDTSKPARAPKKPPAGREDVPGADLPAVQKPKPTRVPKKPCSGAVPQKEVAEDEAHSDAVAHTNQEAELHTSPWQFEDEDTLIANSNPAGLPQMDHPVPATQKAGVLEASDSPERSRYSPVAKKPEEPVLPVVAEHRNVIVLSSEGPGPDDAFARSTSPMFVEQDQSHEPADVMPEITVSVNTGSSDARSPPQLPMRHRRLGFTPPPSFQPRALSNKAGIPRQHDTERQLPADIRNAFFSDEQGAGVSPSPAPELEPCSETESLSPEAAWKRAVEDDSPPAILHRVVQLLHRSLKPREEVVRDIAADYQENALRLLNNMRERHDQEKHNILATIRKVSRASFSVFGGAGQDVVVLIDGLQDLDIAHTAAALTRPALAQKLDAVARLCQKGLSNYSRGGLFADDAASESEDYLDDLADSYRLKLVEAARVADDQHHEGSDKVGSQIAEFIQRCFHGDTRNIRQMEAKKPERPARNADEALEALLDGIIDKLQDDKEGGRFDQPGGDGRSGMSDESDGADMVILN